MKAKGQNEEEDSEFAEKAVEDNLSSTGSDLESGKGDSTHEMQDIRSHS